nr:unnamed protein product [Digitaria exilis]
MSIHARLVEKDGVTSVWGITGLGKSSLVRAQYYKSLIAIYEQPAFTVEYLFDTYGRAKYERYSWVDVPNPFNLVEFARRLLLDFYSDDYQIKQMAAIRMVEGLDPIHWCRKLLGAGNCLIVIDDLRSTEDWDMIKAVFLPHLRNGNSTMVVITSQATVARHCVVNDESKMVNIKGPDADTAFLLFKKEVWGEDCDLTPEEEKLSKDTLASISFRQQDSAETFDKKMDCGGLL